METGLAEWNILPNLMYLGQEGERWLGNAVAHAKHYVTYLVSSLDSSVEVPNAMFIL